MGIHEPAPGDLAGSAPPGRGKGVPGQGAQVGQEVLRTSPAAPRDDARGGSRLKGGMGPSAITGGDAELVTILSAVARFHPGRRLDAVA
jgi:hypothetical protein